jgi:hypothetical protein
MRQGRVDDSWAGAVHAAEFFFDRLDQFVAVARLFGNQLEQHVAQIAVIKNPAMPAAAATTVVMTAKPSAPKAEASYMPPVMLSFIVGMGKFVH